MMLIGEIRLMKDKSVQCDVWLLLWYDSYLRAIMEWRARRDS